MTTSPPLELHPTAPRPASETRALFDRRDTHPFFNDNKMKLGVFAMNCSYGMTVSEVETSFEITWPHMLKIAQIADRMGFEAIVPTARWRGFGGATNFNGSNYETFTWAAGLAQATERIGVFATAHAPVTHPVVAAKQATTIDHISAGRFGLNIVMGWFAPEAAMFGNDLRNHHDRYAFGNDWMDLINKLWTEEGSFDFESTHFNCNGLESYPKPYQGPRPVVINAGNSPAGMAFSARNVDVNLAALTTLEEIQAYTESIKKMARTEYQREIKTMTHGLVVVRSTEAEAKAAYQSVLDHADRSAAENLMRIATGQNASVTQQLLKFQDRMIAGWGGYPIVGTPEQVAEELVRLNEAGMDGFLTGFIDYAEELVQFDETVMPLIRQLGLRN
jgi:FMNH2-dependent dimethyl sulfone monooxygenase